MNRRTVADVQQPKRRATRRGIRLIAFPKRIRLCDIVADLDYALYDVVDVCKIANVLPVIEELDRLVAENASGEQKQSHIWTTPRSVDREKSESARWQRK